MNSFLEPFKDSLLFKVIFAICMFLFTWISNAQVEKSSELYKTLKSKDSIIFERAFNNCEIKMGAELQSSTLYYIKIY